MLGLAAASASAGGEPIAADRDSYARPHEARVVDVSLDLTADFEARRLAGTARLTFERAPGAAEIVLDAHDLRIHEVTDADGRPLTWSLGANDTVHGQPLHVALPAGSQIVIRYETTPAAAALQWLSPEQTAGKRHPYLFSQGQAIRTRTWVPTQDSPGIRQTYSARIVVPRDLVAVMSAESLSPGGVETPAGRAFSFRLDRAIPPYLFALAVGDIAFRRIGERTGVYAEPGVLEAAAWEFADLEKMLAAAEALYGPYLWGRYDILVLPPSFPYGGMENPRLTFMSPTVIAGDRSLTAVAAHELAHSWSGNLVTNATWADFWLNEGFTTYIEERISEQLYGTDEAAALEAVEREDLLTLLERLPPDAQRLYDDKVLLPDEAGDVAYGKGSSFLRVIEQGVGRPRFDTWLRGYFARHAFTSITTAQFLDDLRRNLLGADGPQLEARLRVHEWIYEPGLPDNAHVPRAAPLDRAREQADRFANGAPAASLLVAGWTTQQWLHFLAALPAKLSAAQVADLDRALKLGDRRNAEVLSAWLVIALGEQYAPAVPAAERFLLAQGRAKFLAAVYGSLTTSAWGRPIAMRVYASARPLYHPAAQAEIDTLLQAK